MSKVIRNYFKFKPDRDDILERIYCFMNAISENKFDLAKNMILCDANINIFLNSLNKHILNYATLYFDDEEIDYESDSLTNLLDKPTLMKEEDILPVFTGKNFLVETGEIISIRIGIKGYITNIRINFLLEEYDALYYLRVISIIKEDN